MSGIYLVAAIVLALVTPAKAQQLDMPKTIKLYNKATNEPLGTATLSGNTIYYRDKDGTHYATVVRNADGTRTFYDPSGNVIAPPQLPD